VREYSSDHDHVGASGERSAHLAEGIVTTLGSHESPTSSLRSASSDSRQPPSRTIWVALRGCSSSGGVGFRKPDSKRLSNAGYFRCIW
jgi:hypothetical protein